MPTPKFAYDAQHAARETARIERFHPGAVRWVEPAESTSISVSMPIALAGEGGVWASYRRDTTFAGNLTEALKVMGF